MADLGKIAAGAASGAPTDGGAGVEEQAARVREAARRAETIAVYSSLPWVLPWIQGQIENQTALGRKIQWAAWHLYASPRWRLWWLLTLVVILPVADLLATVIVLPIPVLNVSPSVIIGMIWWLVVLPIPWRRARAAKAAKMEAEIEAQMRAALAAPKADAATDAAPPADPWANIAHIVIGRPTGRLRERGLRLALDPRHDVRATVGSIEEGAVVIGGSGSGKSSCVARPWLRQWVRWARTQNAGAVVIAQKSSAAGEMRATVRASGIPNRGQDVFIIGPTSEWRWNIIAGLSPEAIGRAMVSVLTSGGGGADIVWRSAAEQRIAMFAAALGCAPLEVPMIGADGSEIGTMHVDRDAYSLLRLLAADGPTIASFLAVVRASGVATAAAAAETIQMTDRALPDETRGSIYLSILAVAGQFLAGAASPFVRAFGLADGEAREFPGLSVIDRGGIVVIDCDPAEYPIGARLVGALVREHMVSAAARRADRASNDVLFLLDEYASYASKNDGDFFRTCRSARIAPVPIFQSFATLTAEIGREAASAIVSGARHLLVLPTSDPATIEILAALGGKADREFESRSSGMNLSGGSSHHDVQGRTNQGGLGWSSNTSTSIQQRDIIDADLVASLRRQLGVGVADPFVEAVYFGSPESHSHDGARLGEVLTLRPTAG